MIHGFLILIFLIFGFFWRSALCFICTEEYTNTKIKTSNKTEKKTHALGGILGGICARGIFPPRAERVLSRTPLIIRTVWITNTWNFGRTPAQHSPENYVCCVVPWMMIRNARVRNTADSRFLCAFMSPFSCSSFSFSFLSFAHLPSPSHFLPKRATRR